MLKWILKIVAGGVALVGVLTGATLLLGTEPTVPATGVRLASSWLIMFAITLPVAWWFARHRDRQDGEEWRAGIPRWLRMAVPVTSAVFMASYLTAYGYAIRGELALLPANLLALAGCVPVVVLGLRLERYKPQAAA